MMKRILLLVLLISIPIGLKITEASKISLMNRVETEGYSLQPKDYLWEFVKDECRHGRIDLKTNYKEKYKDPILIAVKNATSKDSIAVEGLIADLKKTFPLKEVAYFSDFAGHQYVPLDENNALEIFGGYYYDELVSFTTHISFDPTIIKRRSKSSSFKLRDSGIKENGWRRDKWNTYFLHSELIFGFEEAVSIKEREFFLEHQFYEFMWHNHTEEIEDAMEGQRIDITFEFGFKQANKSLTNTKIRLDKEKFLIEKLFSNDFQKQFKNYMYKTYPWRYAYVFMDKEKAKQDANAIVVFTGLLFLILSCSLFWNRKFIYSFSNFFFPLLIYVVGFFSLNTLYNYLVQIDVSIPSLSGLFVFFFLLIVLVIVTSFLFWQIEKRLVNVRAAFGYQLLVKLGLTFFFLYFLSISVTYEYDNHEFGTNIQAYLNDLQFLFLAVGLTFGRGILLYLNHFSESLVKQKEVELSRLKEINAQSELKLLQSHINPHFLYNALNSIAGLVHKSPDKSEKMALSLSNLFRYSINKKGQQMSTVNEEVVMVQNYLDIEEIRFGERLTFTLKIDETLRNNQIPMYILQPLVENAIKHGVSKIRGEGVIDLIIKNELEYIVISVADNGPDFPEGLVSGHGLQTVYDLLRLSYGDQAKLQWTNTPIKAIEVKIPLKI